MKQKICPRCHGSGTILDNKAVGELLRNERESANVSATAIASALGVSKAKISKMEAGQRGWKPAMIENYRGAVQKLKGK